MNDVANFDGLKNKTLVSVYVCLGQQCGFVFQCSYTSSTKAIDTNAEYRLHVFLIFPLFLSFHFQVETAKSHFSLCFASSWGRVVWCPTPSCSFFFSNTLFPPSPFSFSLRPRDCHFFPLIAVVYIGESPHTCFLFRFACCREH